MIDNIFGHLIEPDDRLARALENLDGVKHLYWRTPLDPIPGQPIFLTLTTGGPQPYDSARCYFTVDGSDPAAASASVLDLEPAGAKWDEIAWGYVQTWTVTLPTQPAGTLLRYHLAARRPDTGNWIFADNQAASAAKATDFALWVDNDPAPAWARQALVYQIFLDRFYPGDGKAWNKVKNLGDFFGGTLRGVIDKLDYIQSLGFNAIWLSPFFKSTTHHGYNACDYYTVEPRLGTNAELQELIQKAHARGIRLILDFVANHWSKDHPTFQDAQKNPNSPYHDWYIWKKWPHDYEAYFHAKELPKLNLRPGPARAYLLEVARHWLREGFDGYRLDFAYGPPHDFWVDFRRACRAVNPDCWIFGEVVHTAAVQRSYAGIMDGTLDFLLARALRETFAFERMSLAEFEAFLCAHESYFPPEFSRPAFLDNHDMSRFLHIAGDDQDKLKLAALVLYTLSAPPVVYNGTEAGVTQERPMKQGNRYIFEEARLPMKWDAEADAGLLDYFRRLGRLRHAHPVLWNGRRRPIHLDTQNDTYAYLRESTAEKVLVAINLSQSPRTLALRTADFQPALSADERSATDKLNGNRLDFRDGALEINLPPRGGAFICL